MRFNNVVLTIVSKPEARKEVSYFVGPCGEGNVVLTGKCNGVSRMRWTQRVNMHLKLVN